MSGQYSSCTRLPHGSITVLNFAAGHMWKAGSSMRHCSCIVCNADYLHSGTARRGCVGTCSASCARSSRAAHSSGWPASVAAASSSTSASCSLDACGGRLLTSSSRGWTVLPASTSTCPAGAQPRQRALHQDSSEHTACCLLQAWMNVLYHFRHVCSHASFCAHETAHTDPSNAGQSGMLGM